MLVIFHGTDLSSSRKQFLEEKEKLKNSILINGADSDTTQYVQIFEGGSLFSEPKNFFIDSLIGKRKKSRELDNLINVINKNSTDNDIYIWEGKELTPANLKQFNNSINKVFKLPQTLFTFIDQLKPGNGHELIKLFHKTIESTDPEMVFFMIIRQIRLLLYIKEPSSEPIDEVKKMTWQIGKIQTQAQKFEISQLKRIHSKLYEMEIGMKTGTLPMNLTQTIDLLLLKI